MQNLQRKRDVMGWNSCPIKILRQLGECHRLRRLPQTARLRHHADNRLGCAERAAQDSQIQILFPLGQPPSVRCGQQRDVIELRNRKSEQAVQIDLPRS